MKKEDFKGLSDKELLEKIKMEKEQLLKTKMNHKISPIDNPASIRIARRNIARMLTELSNRKKK
ncbi:MAG: 50S ribosomal protein L29 [Bacteroidia bacterium]|nr:50S ribosomal protein L29 [Bacteroidia bacterium]